MEQQNRGTCRETLMISEKHRACKMQRPSTWNNSLEPYCTQAYSIPLHWPQLLMSGCKPRHRLHFAAPAKRQLFPCWTEVLAAARPHTPRLSCGTSPDCLNQCNHIFKSQLHRPIHPLRADSLGTRQFCSPCPFPFGLNSLSALKQPFLPELVLRPALFHLLLHSRQVLSHHCSSLEQGFTSSYIPLCTAQTPPLLQDI